MFSRIVWPKFSPLSSKSMKKNNSVGMVMVDISLLSGLMPNIKDLEQVHMHLSFLLLLHIVLKHTLYHIDLVFFKYNVGINNI